MVDAYAPVKGKCTFWREKASIEDEFDTSVKADDKRVECSCFVEGDLWHRTRSTVPSDCPRARSCRYYVKN